MTPQFPFRCKYRITQGYADNFNNYPEGHHGGLDIVPFNDQGFIAPMEIYPLFSGSEIAVLDTDPVHGEGIKERVQITDPVFLAYLKENGVLPASASIVFLEILYWHILKALDKDGALDTDTPIALAGNTGWVFSGGKPVPDNEKGVPPYPGLHLHLETTLTDGNTAFNLDKDPRGRIDPNIILNFKGTKMPQIKSQAKGPERRIVLAAASPQEWEALCAVFGKDPNSVDETVQ